MGKEIFYGGLGSKFFLMLNAYREGFRDVAGVASATPYFGHIRIGSNKKINYKKI